MTGDPAVSQPSTLPARTVLPHRPGFWLVHVHDEHEPCSLDLGGCRYQPGLGLRLRARLRRLVRR